MSASYPSPPILDLAYHLIRERRALQYHIAPANPMVISSYQLLKVLNQFTILTMRETALQKQQLVTPRHKPITFEFMDLKIKLYCFV
jgi:hypothetical protein